MLPSTDNAPVTARGELPVLIGLSVTIAFFLLIAIPGMLFRAWVLRLLWLWFAVPAFGLAALTYPQAIGLALIVDQFRRGSGIKDEYLDPAWKRLCLALLSDIIAVTTGWILHTWWMPR